VLKVTAQFVLSVRGLRHHNLVIEFTKTERCRRTESRFIFRRKIQVEEEKHMKRQVPKRSAPLTAPHRIRARFNRVAKHVNRGMELPPYRRSPKLNHEVFASWSLVKISRTLPSAK
jgi:hypothetical protein